MKLSPKAKASLEKVVERFQAGDLGPIVKILRIERQGDPVPADEWSLSNRILAFVQTGSLDCRGFAQWKQVGRHVKSGEKDIGDIAWILRPIFVWKTDEDSGERSQVGPVGFAGTVVYPDHATEGEPLVVTDYTPTRLPPLAGIAGLLGISVSYEPLPPDRLGDCAVTGKTIRLGTHETKVWFHELCHAAHAKVQGALKGGQDPRQETIAELGAVILAELYGHGDFTGNAWDYIKGYNKDPLKAIVKALADVEKVLGFILDEANALDTGPQALDA